MYRVIHILGPAAIAIGLTSLVAAVMLLRGGGGLRKLAGAGSLGLFLCAAFVGWKIYRPVAQAHAEPGRVPAVGVGDHYIDFTLQDSDGEPFTLSSLDGQWILLKFFRGHW